MIIEKVCLECVCEQCDHTWTPASTGTPNICPKCKTKKWNEAGQFINPDQRLRRNDVREAAEPIKEHSWDVYAAPGEVPMSKEEKLDNLRNLVAHPEILKPESVDDYRFTKDPVQFHEDGNVYRKQGLWPLMKRTRTVKVDPDDHESILKVVIK